MLAMAENARWLVVSRVSQIMPIRSLRLLLALGFAWLAGGNLLAQATWLPVNSGTSADLWGICYDGSSRYVAVGTNGTIISGGPNHWIQQPSGTSAWLLAVTYGTQFVVVGDQGTILTSPDAVHWTSQNSGTTQRLNGVAYGTIAGAPMYLAVGEAGTVCTSRDGVHWTALNAGITGWLRGVASYSWTLVPTPPGSGFVTAGQNGVVLETVDGATFSSISTGTTENIESLALTSNGSSYIATLLTAGGGGLVGQLQISGFGGQWMGAVVGTAANYYRGAVPSAVVGQAGAVAVANPSPPLGAATNAGFTPLNLNPPSDFNALVEVGGNLVVVGDGGAIWTRTVNSGLAAIGAYSPNLVDSGFTSGVGPVAAIAALPSGKFLTIGPGFFGGDGLVDSSLSRLNADGSVDRSFASISLEFGISGSASITAEPNGRALVQGSFIILNGPENPFRLTGVGTIDSSFKLTATPIGALTALVPLPSGGYWYLSVGKGVLQAQILTDTGSVDPAFGAAAQISLPASINAGNVGNIAATLDSGGGCWVAVNSTTTGSTAPANQAALFRFGASGVSDASFLQGRLLTGFAVQKLSLASGQVWYVGSGVDPTSSLGFTAIGRLNADGSSDPLWPERDLYGGSATTAGAAAVLPDGSAILLNYEPTNGGAITYGVQRITAEDVLDPNYGGYLVENAADAGGIQSVQALSQSQLLITGPFTALNQLGPLSENSYELAASQVVRINLDSQFAATRLANLSVLGPTGTQPLTLGFVVGGTGTKSLLLRASGPALAAFGVFGAVNDPALALFAGSTLVNSDDNWDDNGAGPAVSALALQVGAFPFAAGSKDAALAVSLASGSYSVEATAHGAAGTVLAEAYDADAAPTSYSAPRFLNLSVLNPIGAGSQILTAGFVVGGANAKRVLIRADGPGLTAFGVTGVLPDPVLTLYAGSSPFATNTRWSSLGVAPIASVAQAVGAFPLASGSADSALLAILPAGDYTAQVSSYGGLSGTVLLEVFEVGPAVP